VREDSYAPGMSGAIEADTSPSFFSSPFII